MTTATRIDTPPDISEALLNAPHTSRFRGVRTGPAPTEGTLKVEDLAVTFRSKRKAVEAVRGISFTVEAGKTLVLLGESVLTASPPLFWWFLVVVVVNAAYIPLSEEPGLVKRFGDDYLKYKRNVPRWVPRLRPWLPGVKGPSV